MEELEKLCSAEFTQSVRDNLDRDPVSIALDRHVPDAASVASQVKRLKRAEKKLPSYFRALCILPEKAFEQSSSEATAERKHLSGATLLDLTCGLGVDSFVLSSRFSQVTSVERDPVVARLATENFHRLGAGNITVVNSSAEEFLASDRGHYDWCIVDPDRRGERGQKLVTPEQCSPNVVALLPEILGHADRVCIKCSPLFDAEEALRRFEGCSVEVVSSGTECREVNIYLERERKPTLAAVSIGKGDVVRMIDSEREAWSETETDVGSYRYLIIPDAAVHHARLCREAFRPWAEVWSDDGIALSNVLEWPVLGRVFEIEEAVSYSPRILKAMLRSRKIEIIRRNFMLSNAEIARSLGCREGGSERWCFTRIGDTQWAFRLGKEIR